MWHSIASQLDATAFAAIGLFYRYPLVFSGTVLAAGMLASMLCFEIRKAEKLQAAWNDERARYDRPVRLRR